MAAKLPSTMKAIKVQSAGKAAIVSDAPVPQMRDDQILVKVHAVGLNPTDWKHIDFLPQPSATVGCDYAGTVISCGPSVSKSHAQRLTPGTRVAGFVHGVSSVSPQDGAFGEYCVAKGDVAMPVPDNFSFEDAATLGVSISTVGQGLYQSLGVPKPGSGKGGEGKEKEAILIYGGATATGLYAIQYAKLSGLTVVTTCSPRNFELVKKYGADAAFDYSDAAKCGKEIREFTKDRLKWAFDCISAADSPRICAEGLASNAANASGKLEYSSLLPVPNFPRKDVDVKYTLAYTILNETFMFRDTEMKASREDFEFAVQFWQEAEVLVREGKIRAPPLFRESGDGFDGVMEGLGRLREGKVSGGKIVCVL